MICTGISGTDRLDWLRQVVERARGRGLNVSLYDVRETMFDIARAVGEPVDEETILDMFPRALVLLRAAALEQICSAIAADPARAWILNTHAVFRWKNTLISGFDPHYLARLDPHLFITITSGIRVALATLRQQPRWTQLTEDDLLIWREEEQFFTEEMARIHRKPQLLVPRALGLEDGYRLLFEPDCPRAYLSYPMQHVVAGEERVLSAFKQRLAQRFVVFDPSDVNDVVGLDEALQRSDGTTQLTPSSRLQQHMADQIVVRDYKLIDQSDVVVVFYDVAVPSPGVISEMKFALESGKQVFGVWLPPGEPSVFFTHYCSTWFRSPDALFDHFEHRAPIPSGSRGAGV